MNPPKDVEWALSACDCCEHYHHEQCNAEPVCPSCGVRRLSVPLLHEPDCSEAARVGAFCMTPEEVKLRELLNAGKAIEAYEAFREIHDAFMLAHGREPKFL